MSLEHVLSDDVSLLRFATAGSVDDGKSTLIGRLLYDTKGLFEDQIEALEQEFDLAKITDGLRAEREQGITIDVAHRYFATPKRRFMIADCPGHTQYTRNAITGMSHADVALLLVDARLGIQTQTRRHAQLASMLGLSAVIVCINKMDLVDWSAERYHQIETELRDAFAPLQLRTLHILPLSALLGSNVNHREPQLSWFTGPTLLELLENIEIDSVTAGLGGRMPVQLVLRPENGAGRCYAGRVAGGTFSVGDEVVLLPRGNRTKIRSIDTFDGPLQSVQAPKSISMTFEDDVDVARGDLIATAKDAPQAHRRWELTIAWMSETPLKAEKTYLMKVGTQKTRVVVRRLDTRLNLETLQYISAGQQLDLNDIGRIEIEAMEDVAVDKYSDRPDIGRCILMDPWSKETVGAGLLGTL
ncbi:MAG: 50S ribosome-binding GTPase [Myxococcales bacterium]|nr:50S ribosome-binding GTPase [Myxococcales bacterium]